MNMNFTAPSEFSYLQKRKKKKQLLLVGTAVLLANKLALPNVFYREER